MRVAAVSVLQFRRELDGRSYNPTMRWTERRAPLLVLRAEDGSTGIGEAWSRQAGIAHVLDALATVGRDLVGRDLHDAALFAGAAGTPPDGAPDWVAPAAASAVDMALWDLRARLARQPLWRMLGGRGASPDGSVAVYASGGLYRDGTDASDLANEMRRCLADGFTAVKMKIGALPVADDLARIAAVKAAVGSEATLWVDAVNQLPRHDPVATCRALAAAGAHAIQAPVPFDDLATMAAIQRAALPVIAAEGEHAESLFVALLEAEAVACLQFCLGLCGGYTGGARLCALAAARGVPSTPQCFSTAIMQAASLQFGAAQRAVATVEYHRFHDHLAALLPSCMRTVVAGRVTLDATPGLGIDTVELGPQAGGGEITMHAQFD